MGTSEGEYIYIEEIPPPNLRVVVAQREKFTSVEPRDVVVRVTWLDFEGEEDTE